eukprot:365362-Chlamydomonas_euryale.AAC.12
MDRNRAPATQRRASRCAAAPAPNYAKAAFFPGRIDVWQIGTSSPPLPPERAMARLAVRAAERAPFEWHGGPLCFLRAGHSRSVRRVAAQIPNITFRAPFSASMRAGLGPQFSDGRSGRTLPS